MYWNICDGYIEVYWVNATYRSFQEVGSLLNVFLLGSIDDINLDRLPHF